MSTPVYVIDGVRTPFGRRSGALAGWSSLDLGSAAVGHLISRHPNLRQVDAALMGVVVQAALGQNPARTAVLRGGVDPTVPASTLNNVCLAGLDTVCDASRRVRSGEGEVFLVGGFDSMSRRVEIVRTSDQEVVDAIELDGLTCAVSGLGMGVLSDLANADLGIDREVQDDWALLSHRRAATAPFTETGEIMEIDLGGAVMSADEGIRRDTSAAALARLKPAFRPDGTITAGNAAQTTDGAAVGVVGTIGIAERMGVAPLCRVVDWAYAAGPDPTLHLQPARAIGALLSRTGLGLSDIDLFEINEAFACVVVASNRELGLPDDVVNPNGGAIALGHPLGGTGFRLLHTLALELRRRDLRRGIAALCGGGGQGLAVLIERDE